MGDASRSALVTALQFRKPKMVDAVRKGETIIVHAGDEAVEFPADSDSAEVAVHALNLLEKAAGFKIAAITAAVASLDG